MSDDRTGFDKAEYLIAKDAKGEFTKMVSPFKKKYHSD